MKRLNLVVLFLLTSCSFSLFSTEPHTFYNQGLGDEEEQLVAMMQRNYIAQLFLLFPLPQPPFPPQVPQPIAPVHVQEVEEMEQEEEVQQVEEVLVQTTTTKHTCKTCGKRLSCSSNLKRHNDSFHTGVKPYKCEHCPRTFSNSSNRRKHERAHLKKIGGRVNSESTEE